MKRTLVIPTCRPESIRKWAAQWRDKRDWHETIVVWDGEGCGNSGVVDLVADAHWGDSSMLLSWDDIPVEGVFSRRDSAIRSLGFLEARKRKAGVILTMDDDCYPLSDDWSRRHERILSSTCQWESTCPGLHVRGMPYRGTGGMAVGINVGLWHNCPDLDAIQTLGGGLPIDGYVPTPNTVVWGRGQYRPMCGMNMAFAGELTPLMLFSPMGEGQPYGRFDDIWCGVIAKKVCDHLGWSVTSGPPFVEHVKASDPIANLRKETPGILEHERFWHCVDDMDIEGDGPMDAMDSVACHLRAFTDEQNMDEVTEKYYRGYAHAIVKWLDLLKGTQCD